MAGHNRWSQIKRKKAVLDSRKGKTFTKILKEITASVKESGADPEGNARLRLAIQNAKGVNCPKDNIERAIKKGLGNEGSYIETTYEGYAPFGVAVFVECMTDNLQRTVQDVRMVFNKFDGSLGTNGSLEFIFSRKGVFNLADSAVNDKDAFTLNIIDAGAEDIETEDGYISVITAREDFGRVQKALESMQIVPENAELQRIPNTLVKLSDEQFQQVMKLIDMLEDLDDVQKVYHNIELSESQVELI